VEPRLARGVFTNRPRRSHTSRPPKVHELWDRRGGGSRVAGKAVRVGAQPMRQGAVPTFPKAIFREIVALQALKGHPNVVRLLDVYPQDTEVMLVFEFMQSDLEATISAARAPLPVGEVKFYVAALLRALRHCHAHGILHRDVKPANCLLSASGELKLADFGLARPQPASDGPRQPLSHQVATRWYRAPELLFGARHYDGAVDIWGVGAVFAELLTLHPLFPGNSDIDQLYRVLQLLGTPTSATWPGVDALPDFGKIVFPPMRTLPWSATVPGACAASKALLARLLSLDPRGRPTAASALAFEYFAVEPAPCRPAVPRERPTATGKTRGVGELDWELHGGGGGGGGRTEARRDAQKAGAAIEKVG